MRKQTKNITNNLLNENSNDEIIILVENLWKVYNGSEVKTVALKNATFDIKKGTFLAIVGASGSGKSTLLHLLAGLDHPTKKEGTKLEIKGESISDKSENWLAQFRAANVGFVLQFFGLLPSLIYTILSSKL